MIPADSCVKLLMLPDRATLHARADARFQRMVEQGALDEATQIGALQLDAELPAMRAIGVAPMIAAACGILPVADAVVQAQAETRQYIKRQETWLRRNMISWNNCHQQLVESSAASAMSFMQS